MSFGRLSKLQAARREIFWLAIRAVSGVERIWRLSELPRDQPPFWPNNDDFGWLREDSVDLPDQRERLLAVDGALRVASAEQLPVFCELLEVGSPERQRCSRYQAHRASWSLDRGQARQRRARELRHERAHERDLEILQKCLPALRSGADLHNLRVLYGRLQQLSEGANSWGLPNWESLEEGFGPKIARAFRDGCIALARNGSVALPPTGSSRSVPMGVVLGLTGMATLSAGGTVALEFSADRASALARLALWELNGFPDWFQELLAQYPAEVAHEIQSAVDADLTVDPPLDIHWNVLQRLHLETDQVRRAAAPSIRAWLQRSPPDAHQTDTCLRLVADGARPTPPWLQTIAPTKVRELSSSSETLIAWWLIWAGAEPLEATTHLESLVEESEEGGLRLLERVGSSPLLDLQSLPVKALEVLARTALSVDPESLGHDYVGGGTWTVDWRDDLRRFRQAVPELLSSRGGAEAHDALVRLGSIRALKPWEQDYMAQLAHLAAVRDASTSGWLPAQFVAFSTSGERVPRTQSELFSLVRARLLRIAREVKDGDVSLRDMFHEDTLEDRFQNWLTGELRRLSFDKYIAEREVQVGRRKRPDLMVTARGIESQIPIELKPANRYKVEQLKEAIAAQLCDKYLRDPARTHGFLVLCSAAAGKPWSLPDGRAISLKELRSHLQDYADSLVADRDEIDKVDVIAMDFVE